MHERLALRLLRRIMDWDEETATREYAWVRLIARLKYDGYRDYIAGVRFTESLAGWLHQFEIADRQAAYDFIKHRLIYFSPPEIQRLIEQFYPRTVEPSLREAASREANVPPYMVWADPNALQVFNRKRRQTLFVGLSDGARIDMLRRTNSGMLANDQIVLATHIDDEKWIDLSKKLGESNLLAGQVDPMFEKVYLVDDFTGSGTTFLRRKRDGSWTGKVKKLWDAIELARRRLAAIEKSLPLAPNFSLHIHHYISSHQARTAIVERLAEIAKERSGDWFAEATVSQGLLLPDTVKMSEDRDPDSWHLFEKYYDHDLFEQLREHLEESGQTHIRHGYGDSALPVVLEHNCPNNAMTLLWAQTTGQDGHPMRPLFPRRHRHS